METVLDNVHEIAAVGTIFPDSSNKPILHMHAACGRNTDTVTGCVRRGVKVWQVLEVVIQELLNTTAHRELEPATGFELLQP
jgi:predicted DNA-binding protein with PD1-like motif